jgi:threonine/homoserine/homoserine lactone efflux protein
MQYFLHIILGFTMAFVSLTPPGMLNMTAVRTKIEKTQRSALLFSLGAAIIVIPQAYIALAFAKYFVKHPEIIDRLTIAGIIVLFAMSIFFLFQARKKFKGEGKKQKGNFILIGMLLSAMNMLAIPFYLVLSSVLEKKGLLIMSQPYISIFVGGVFLGAFSLFATYVFFASFIEKKAQFIARNINYILSVLFLFLGILTLFKYLK